MRVAFLRLVGGLAKRPVVLEPHASAGRSVGYNPPLFSSPFVGSHDHRKMLAVDGQVVFVAALRRSDLVECLKRDRAVLEQTKCSDPHGRY